MQYTCQLLGGAAHSLFSNSQTKLRDSGMTLTMASSENSHKVPLGPPKLGTQGQGLGDMSQLPPKLLS